MKKKKILIASPAYLSLSYYSQILSDYNVVTIAYGPEIINKFNQEKPDIFIINSNIDSDCGFELIREIRKISATVKIIMLAGITVDNNEALAIGCDLCCQKPIKPKKLQELVK